MSTKTVSIDVQTKIVKAFDSADVKREELAKEYNMSVSTLRRRIPGYRENVERAERTAKNLKEAQKNLTQQKPTTNTSSVQQTAVTAKDDDFEFELTIKANPAWNGVGRTPKVEKMTKLNVMRQLYFSNPDMKRKELLSTAKEVGQKLGLRMWTEASLVGCYNQCRTDQKNSAIII